MTSVSVRLWPWGININTTPFFRPSVRMKEFKGHLRILQNLILVSFSKIVNVFQFLLK
jgi:hypothetical protein